MTAWFGAVWSRTLAESDKLIFGREKDMLKTGFAALGVISMIYSAFFFAIHDYGRVNIIVSFAVGFFTGAVWCLLFYGPVVLWIFLVVLFSFLPGPYEKEPTQRVQKISIIAASIVVIAAWIVTFDLLKNVPALGHQLTFMFRDTDDS
jgi:hypothetical protein